MILLKSHIKPTGQGLLPDGNHIVRIESVIEANSPEKWTQWNDKTPQLSIRYKNNKGYITHWINLKGYMTREDYSDAAELKGIVFREHPYNKIQYAVDLFTGCRIENSHKTETCLHILGRIGNCAGIPQDINFTPDDLVGRELGISVYNQKVIKTYKKL